MPELTSKQRRFLRGQAHDLQAVVQVGQKGLSPSVLREIDNALMTHELIKVRLAGDRDERRHLAATIAAESGADIAGQVGAIVILFRPQPDPDARRYRLPE